MQPGPRDAMHLIMWSSHRLSIILANKPIAHGRRKHIVAKYHILVIKGSIELMFRRLEDQLADIVTIYKAIENREIKKMRRVISI